MRIFSRRRSASPAAAKPASKPIPAGKGYSLLDSQLTVTGDLETTASLRIEGNLDGSVLSADSVVIGVGSRISGDIHAREVVVGGTITGNVHASERVELQATAVVTGDVHTGSILIQEGGVVNGRVLMGPPGSVGAHGRPLEPAGSARR
ncbi:MAG: polymer-forming cytoskeletal protein [Gemmatimonadaceae bacterium]|nr:polymer-forming cytoskeletal protein [Gemmatimonadaceae bacterium]NUO94578.1 polymer-forming cytoskeletal protein [Gemmatimonadaceae bacterium]NUP57710.1 polymer-forming cytoskeletal protein [Gemmatimonadaceae bacterium]NUP69703.1 polymer-forming cytoskeletal protein [Gemmatimonadaceae bacterium]NUR32721.1 polymer-forming cytoskeletal protein [Gemmatimonadaceae bacterium]